jgi:hypothetical protein
MWVPVFRRNILGPFYILIMEAVYSSETPVSVYQTILYNCSEGYNVTQFLCSKHDGRKNTLIPQFGSNPLLFCRSPGNLFSYMNGCSVILVAGKYRVTPPSSGYVQTVSVLWPNTSFNTNMPNHNAPFTYLILQRQSISRLCYSIQEL